MAAALRAEYNLDKPFIVQYLIFVGGIFVGDFGTSFSGQPVSAVLAQTFPVTLRLALLAVVIESVAGILIGLVSGLRKGKLFDSSALVVSLAPHLRCRSSSRRSSPQYVFGIKLGIARTTVGPGRPVGGSHPPGVRACDGELRLHRAAHPLVGDREPQ